MELLAFTVAFLVTFFGIFNHIVQTTP